MPCIVLYFPEQAECSGPVLTTGTTRGYFTNRPVSSWCLSRDFNRSSVFTLDMHLSISIYRTLLCISWQYSWWKRMSLNDLFNKPQDTFYQMISACRNYVNCKTGKLETCKKAIDQLPAVFNYSEIIVPQELNKSSFKDIFFTQSSMETLYIYIPDRSFVYYL